LSPRWERITVENRAVPGRSIVLLAVVWGSPLIKLLKHYGIGKKIRIEGPATHQVKVGTPTMGGLMIVVPVLVITGGAQHRQLARRDGDRQIHPGADDGDGVLCGAGCDRRHHGRARQARRRNARESQVPDPGDGRDRPCAHSFFVANIHSVVVPTVPDKIDIGLLWIPIAAFIIVLSSNAVNMTDGLDGLAGIIAATAFMAYAVIAYLQSFQIEPYPESERPVVSYLVPFSLTVAGACMAFLWFNAHPAQMFMGDTGSEALALRWASWH